MSSQRVAHIYAASAKINSGDFMIGIAYKEYFKHNYINGSDLDFTNFDCRNESLYNSNAAIAKLNSFDYILIGGGGLILPDSAPNTISCWQWHIKKHYLEKLTVPIYVLGIGYNTFFGQTMAMPNRENNKSELQRLNIFTDNIKLLAYKATVFTMRHKADVSNLLNDIGEEYKDKIKYEICATHWYAQKMWSLATPSTRKFIAIEVKDDRQWRRYYKIGMPVAYSGLLGLVKHLRTNGEDVCYLSHDGSKSFYTYMKNNGINIPLLDNSSANESKIKANYNQIHTLFCMAGHSQIIGDACGIKTIGLVTHPKVRNFCDDCGSNNYVMLNDYKDAQSLTTSLINSLNAF
jgi:hypothetical protein